MIDRAAVLQAREDYAKADRRSRALGDRERPESVPPDIRLRLVLVTLAKNRKGRATGEDRLTTAELDEILPAPARVSQREYTTNRELCTKGRRTPCSY